MSQTAERNYKFVGVGDSASVGSARGNGREARTGEIRKLTSLLEISQALSAAMRIKSGLQQVLEILEQHHGVIRSSVTLLDDASGDLEIEASSGLSAEGQRARYRVGEGITGRVVESSKPVVVPKVSREPLFLNRAAQRGASGGADEVTFICVPIVINRKAIGSLGVDLRFKPDRDYDRSQKFYSIVASLIAQAVKIKRLAEAERQRLMEENTHLREELRERYDFSNLIGNSGPMRQVYEQVTQVAHTSTTVMIRGESGTGKELIAHAIHYNSPRKNKPFIKVNCAALPETLIEAELFGHERGAFTGAQAQKKGRFELAEGGTLFLDEIGEINASTAVKLLRVLQEREFERLGGTQTIKTDVRLLVATNKDLEKAIAAGGFREDLYYRLNVFSIFVPPLRERKSDILLLSDYFLEKYAGKHGKDIKRISTPAIDMLTSYHWPGNVRELENTMERAVLVCDGSVIHGHHLPPTLQTAEASGTVMSVSLKEAVEAYEKDIIQDTLKTTRGNRSRASNLLKSTERIINYKIKKYQIDCNRFRS
jgi:Nif-specific regulatory protein